MDTKISLLVDIDAGLASKASSKSFTKSMSSKGIDLDLVPLDTPTTTKGKKKAPQKGARKTVKYLASSNLNESDIHPWDFAQLTAYQQKKEYPFCRTRS